MFTVKKELGRLEREVEKLKEQVDSLTKISREERRVYKQWDNLLSYTGKAQGGNLDED